MARQTAAIATAIMIVRTLSRTRGTNMASTFKDLTGNSELLSSLYTAILR